MARPASVPPIGNFVSLDAAGRATPLMDETRWVGTPRMNAIVRNLADQHHVHWSKRIVQIGSVDEGWLVETDEGERAGPFKRLIVAIPAEQAAVLLDGVDQALAKRAGRARSKPCWSVMCAFAEPVSVPWDGAQLLGNALSWCSRERSKPKRERAEAWVLHASREWSTANLEVEPDVAAAELVRAFRELTGAPMPGFLSAHRWRYSQPEVTNPAMHVWRDDFSLGVCGDWCGGGTVEAAWMSGVSIVEALGE